MKGRHRIVDWLRGRVKETTNGVNTLHAKGVSKRYFKNVTKLSNISKYLEPP